ncbi:mannose-6-phosphate isomerase, class I [Peribacillus loiseleuriae]|uniref:Mannose-6-phosphate isomerase n=1 Tax=Peribacillus loiseleuriae TaxID=1679170 RepID=A0A0K9GTW5_9BACI|nr:mannose-6-phosphate isomerase, class I [Peribacillus loiseleuriae]KMY49712.1 mannose-6-phosphate isomerase [Peribacillus loiseleuriae]
MKEPIFFSPVFHERLWGGYKLKTEFNYNIHSNNIGECWAISAHPNGQSVIRDGLYKGLTLGELWEGKKELFGSIIGDKFPLLIKILDANDDLSVQVHPNDMYANQHENGELGKTECWYIIDCEKDAELIFGHYAQSKEELVKMIDEGSWDTFLRRVRIKKGDFISVPSGTVHALCKGTLVLEIQQNSDTTYRLYDYNRKGEDGNMRDLHLEKSKEVITVPYHDEKIIFQDKTTDTMKITTFLNGDYFTVYKWVLDGKETINQEFPFLLCSVIEGEGLLIKNEKVHSLTKGTHFLLPHGFNEFQLKGMMELIVSHV